MELDAKTLAESVRRAGERYVRLHRQGSMATVSAMILFEALARDIERTNQPRADTMFGRQQLREAMAAHPAWEGKAYEESSFNTVPEDLGEQLRGFAHEEYLDGARWRFTFAGPTRKFRADKDSRELFLEVRAEELERPEPAPAPEPAPPSPPRRPFVLAVAIAAAALVLIAVAWLVLKKDRSETAPASRPVTLAVLPFRILGSDQKELEFFGIGVADSIITRLSNVRQLRIRPTSAIVRYERDPPDPRTLGRELEVEYLLNGTLQRSGDRFRASVQLIRAADGSSVWGRQFDVSRGDFLSLEDQVADSVTAALPITVDETDRLRMGRGTTADASAHEQYLRGRASLLLQTRPATEEAIRSFDAALRHDPKYARARAGLAVAAAQMRLRSATSEEVKVWEERAKREATEALRVAPEVAEAHEALAAVYRYTEFDWERTMEESSRAIALNPNLELPHYYRAAAASHLGLLDLAVAETRAGMQINPSRPVEALRLLGVGELFRGNYTDAVKHLEEVSTSSDIAGYYLGLAYFYLGRVDKAEELLRKLGGGETRQFREVAALASIVARGNRAEAEGLLRTIEAAERADHHVAFSAGAAYAQLGRPDDAVRWLTRAAETGFPCAPWYERDPLLEPLREDPRFLQLLDRLRRGRDDAARRYR
jgi:TolB-like protein